MGGRKRGRGIGQSGPVNEKAKRGWWWLMGGFRNRTGKYSILNVVSKKQAHPNKCPVRTLYEQTLGGVRKRGWKREEKVEEVVISYS